MVFEETAAVEGLCVGKAGLAMGVRGLVGGVGENYHVVYSVR